MSQLSKFQGCLVGALIGDCFGANFELAWHDLKLTQVQSWLSKMRGKQCTEQEIQNFTDDTAMCRGIAQSLIECKEFDAKHMAKRFTENYFKEQWRGYGASISQVFTKLRDSDYSEPYRPAAEQFEGNGSYGNGGAMRVAPVALFTFTSGVKAVQDLACQVTRLTHSHPQAIRGAALLATAQWLALSSDQTKPFTPLEFITNLRHAYNEFDICPATASGNQSETDSKAEFSTYDEKLHYIEHVLTAKEEPSRKTIVHKLGTDIAAFESVPAAIYSFLRSDKPVPGLESSNSFERTVLYAISLGGDTDTVASMAGSVAGAYWGEYPKGEKSNSGIEWQLSSCCESVQDARDYAKELFDLNKDSS